MHIVYVAQFAGTPQYGMILGNYYLAHEWVKLGHEVTIITASFAHTRFKQPPQNRDFIRQEFIDGIRYLWLRCAPYQPGDRIGRIKNIFSFAAKCYFRKLPIQSADLVISSSIHPFTIFPAQKLAKKFDAKLVMEVRDLWPLTLIELGGASKSNPFILLMQWAENYAYRNADRVVSVLPKAKEYMVQHGMDQSKFLYIPNGIVTNRQKKYPLPQLHEQQLNDFIAKHSFCVGYAGKMGTANALKPLIEAKLNLKEKGVGIVFLGDGAARDDLMRYTQEKGLEKQILFLSPVEKDQVPSFLKLMDALYIGLKKKPLFRFGISPSKLNDYLLAAKPIVFAIDAFCEAASESRAGINCDPDSSTDIANAIEKIYLMDSPDRELMGLKGKEWVVANRDYGMLAQKYLSGVETVVTEPPHGMPS